MPRRTLRPGEHLWPIHLRPKEDELLSSWMVRLAYAHDIKLRTFGRLLAGEHGEVWYRDVDRLAPKWLIAKLAQNTGLTEQAVHQCTLRAYEGRIFREYREFGIIPWILPLKVFEWKRKGFGLQICPQCLAEGDEPYFRKRWRVAFCTWCTKHNALLLDRCPECSAPISFHRHDLNENTPDSNETISCCSECGFDYRQAKIIEPPFYDQSSKAAFEQADQRLEHKKNFYKPRGVTYYNLLRQLCHIMEADYRNVMLRQFVETQLGLPRTHALAKRIIFEACSIEERHHIIQLGFWCMADYPKRLTVAWNAGAITHSALIRDFDDRPREFNRLIRHFIDWRKRKSEHGQLS